MNIIISFSILFGCLLFNTSSVLSDNQIEENNQKTFLLSWNTTQLITLCMQPMMNLTKFENELQTSKVEGNLTEFFTSQCLIKDPLQHCVEQKYTTYFGQSVTNIEIRERNFNSDLIRDIIKYHCSNQGLIILTSYFNNIEYNCVEQHNNIFKSCFQKTLKNDSFIGNNSNEVNCAGIKVVQNCVSFHLQHPSICNGIEVSTYINGLLNKIFDDNICKNRSDVTEGKVTTERARLRERLDFGYPQQQQSRSLCAGENSTCDKEVQYALSILFSPLCDKENNEIEEFKTSYESKMTAVKIYGSCMNKTLNFETFFTSMVENKNNQNLTQYFKSFCCSQENAILCFNNTIQCFTTDFLKHEGYTNYFTSNLQFLVNQMSYLCHDEGRLLAEYINDTDINCLSSRINNLINSCFQQLEYTNWYNQNRRNIKLNHWCSTYKELFDCIINEMRYCETQTGASILLERFFNKIYDEHLCTNNEVC